MARKTMTIEEFLRKTFEEAFVLAEAKFAPVKEERKKKITQSALTQLTSVVSESFLNFLETAKEPKAIVSKIFGKMNGFPPPYQIQLESGELDREHFLEEAAAQTVHHIAALMFIAPPEASEYSSFMKDLKELHDFLRQIQAASIVERESGGNHEDIEDYPINLGPDDKTKLITEYSRSIISVPALIKKISSPGSSIGQYL